jgi:hypothetical protein
VALAVPIATHYTNDFATAWYAVSVVPNVALAGQGVSQIGTPITMLLAFAMLLVIQRLAYWLFEGRWNFMRNVLYWTIVVLILTIIYLLWQAFVILVEPNIRRIVPGDIYLFITSAVVFALLPVRWLGLEFRKGDALPRTISKKRLLIVVATLVFLSFVASFSYLVLVTPELPQVEMETTETKTLQGALVTHTDRYWYFFNGKGELVAIPDAEVRTVRFPADN